MVGLAVLLALLAACAAGPRPPSGRDGPGPGWGAPAPAGCGAEVAGLQRRLVAVGSGVVLHVAVGGPPDAPPVILLHGFPETWRTWAGVAVDLAVDHHVIVPDLRGVGCSSFAPRSSPRPGGDPAGAPYDATALAGDLAALTTALGLGPATVVGHDMGVMPAVAWARTRPDQVRGLVLSGGGVPGYGLETLGPPHLARFAAPPGVVAGAMAGHEREFLTRFVADPAVQASGALDDAVRAYSRPGRLDAALGQYRGLARDAAANRADPRPLAMPVTTMEGGAPGISAATVAALAPARTVVVVPGAGHYVQQDRPTATAAAIRAATSH